VYVSGFAGHPGGYFIDCESALGVMTGWRTLLEYQTVGFSSRMRGFSLNSVYGSRIEDFLRIWCQGAGVFACSAKIKFRIRLKTVKFASTSRRESSQYKHRS
jgi:hypothetical protein